ncbi:uncharacterized protein [Vicugna pacos]|uniref:Transport and Golgi organization protein 1 homolog n=1 Tax=Vicugna pacos TaxID=30538 RepID=A0ABM5EFB3_VICPA
MMAILAAVRTMQWTEECESLGRQPSACPCPGITLMSQLSSTGSFFLLLLVTQSIYILRTLVLSHPGSDVYELLWKLILIAAAWGVPSFLSFVWKTIVAVELPVTQVTLKQITGKIKSLEKENRELAENISAWKQKTDDAKKYLGKTTRQKKMLSEEALKFENLETIEKDNEYLNDMIQIARAKVQAARDQNAKRLRSPRVLKTRSEGSMQNAVMTVDCSLEDHHAASGSVNVVEEASFQKLKKKARCFDKTCGQRNIGTEGRRVECHGQTWEAEITWRHQVPCLPPDTPSPQHLMETVTVALRTPCHGVFLDVLTSKIALAVKKAQDNWLGAQELERENAQLRRENAHLKQRLDITCRERQTEEYMRQDPTPGGPHRLPPPLRDSGPGAAPVQNGNSCPSEAATEAQVTFDARGPHPYPGPPPPGTTLCPVQPRPPLPAAPLDGISIYKFGKNKESSDKKLLQDSASGLIGTGNNRCPSE